MITPSQARLALILGLALTSTTPAPAQTPSCAQVVEGLQARTAALNNEARINSVNFLRDELVGPALGSAKTALAESGDPTVAAYNKVQDAREKAQAWIDRLNSFDDFFQRLKQCGETNCNMFDFIKAENERSRLAQAVQDRLNEWVQSLGDSGITAAAERVNKAASIVRNAVTGAQGIAQDGITGAVSCMGQYMQTAQAAQADAVDPTSTPAATAPAGRSGGGGIGKLLGVTAAGAVAVLGGLYVYEQSQLLAEETASFSSNTTTSNPAPSGNTNSGSTITAFQITCTLSNAGTFRTCTGFITATIGPSVTAGVPLIARTFPSEVLGRVTPSSSGAGQSLRFEVSTSSTAACQSISGVNFVRASDVNTVISSASRNITVTCN